MTVAARPVRVLMVLDHTFPPDARVENEAVALIEAGFEVGLLAIAPDTRPRRERYKGMHLFRDPLGRQARDKLRGLVGATSWYDWYLDRRIRQVYRDWPFQVLHLHDLYLFGGGLRARRRLGVPVVGDLHENYVAALQHYAWSTRFPGKLFVNIPQWERKERAWVNAVDALIVVIEEAAARNRALGVPDERITIVSNTVNRAEFDHFETEPALIEDLQQRFTLTYTGGFDAHRGIETAIQAMPHIRRHRPDARLVLVGAGRTHAELESLTRDLGLEDHVQFEGWQPQARLKSYILGSSVCLVPHHKTPHTDATIPHKLFHYMYLKRPVIVSNCLPLERIVTETGAGLVFESSNPEALAQAVLQLAETPEEALAMGEKGHQAVMERYNWRETATALVRLYEGLAVTSRA